MADVQPSGIDSANGGYLPARQAFFALKAALDRADQSVGIQVVSDSTGNAANRWPYLLGQQLATKYPGWTVEWWNYTDANNAYDLPVKLQTGTGGERGLQINPVSGYSGLLKNGDFTTPTGDLDIRVKASAQWQSIAANQTLVAKFATGQRMFRFYLSLTTGRLFYDYSTDGTTPVSKASTVALDSTAYANGNIGWVRVTHTLNNGSAGNDVKFYTSTDGTTWTQLGATVTTAGAVTLFNTSTSDWEIGARNGNGEPLIGSAVLYRVYICNGLAGNIVSPLAIDRWYQIGQAADPVKVGAPTLFVMAGASSGAGLSPGATPLLSDATRLGHILLDATTLVTFLAESHNDGYYHGIPYQALYRAWIAAIKPSIPLSAICVLTENPRLAPATQINEHSYRLQQQVSLAAEDGYTFLDIYKTFLADGRAMSTLVAADGIHPSDAAGSPLWATTVYNAIVGTA